jgi:pyrroline-5-carboxylate reductase
MSTSQIACLGGGNMGRALLQALLRAGTPATNLAVGEPHAATRVALARELGIAAHASNVAAIQGAQVVILAVKPQEALATLTSLRSVLAARDPVLLSVAAGLRCADLAAASGAQRVVRAMPNRPALVGAGATGLFAADNVDTAARDLASAVMRAAGTVVWLPDEAMMDAVTALSGSGPAYFFLMAEALAAAGVAQGLSAEIAGKLAIATLQGAGVMAAQSDGDLARLRAEVTSKGGTTAAALEILDAPEGLRPLLARAVAAATRRAQELGRQTAAEPNNSSRME